MRLGMRRSGRCPRCSYNLAGLGPYGRDGKVRCPECGERVRPGVMDWRIPGPKVLAAAVLLTGPGALALAVAAVDHRGGDGLPLDGAMRLAYALLLLAGMPCSVGAVYVVAGSSHSDVRRGIAVLLGLVVAMVVAGATVLIGALVFGGVRL